MRAYLRDAYAGRSDNHRLVRRMSKRGELELVLRRRRAAKGCNLAVGPRLLRDPFERVPAILIGAAKHPHLAFRKEASALVLLDDGVASIEQLGLEGAHLRFI